jgi:drug/metabolite transporter (DMT)-like permease
MAEKHLKGILIAFLGVTTLSPDSLLVRLLNLEQWTLQFWREVGVSAFIFAALWGAYRGRAWEKTRAIGLAGVLAAACFSLSSILFISSLYLTTVANTLAIISSAPVWGALLSRFMLKEKLPLRTWAATILSMACIAVIVSGDLSGGAHDSLLGDLLALVQAVFMAAAFVLVRSRPEVNMLPCRALGGVFTAVFSLGMALAVGHTLVIPPEKLPLAALLCLFVLPVSFGLLVLAPRNIPAPEVNMIMLLEMVFGPILVWAVVGEAVPPATLAGGGLLFAVLLAHSALGVRARRMRFAGRVR